MNSPFLDIQQISKSFEQPMGWLARAAAALRLKEPARRRVYAVNSVSLQVRPGEIVGLVGESGCGKSTLGRMAAGLLEPTEGEIRVDGQPLVHGGPHSVHRQVQMVFQNPYASLNPRMRVGDILTEAPVYHRLFKAREARARTAELLRSVGLDPSYAERYPHQFSGGQRQRVAIARALAMQPRMLVCDEAVSALDVSVQAQILNLFLDLRESGGLSYLFISHNLSVVQYLADRVAIMYLGRIVELADTQALFSAPRHPYTQALIADAPRLDAKAAEYRPIQGELPSPLDPPSGCAFHPRCPRAMSQCRNELPPLVETSPGHLSACHLHPAPSSVIRVITPPRSSRNAA